MTTKEETQFEQRMFDIIATQNPAAAALNCMDIAKDYAKACALQKVVGSCSWAITQEYGDEYYETDCGEIFCMTDGAFEENSQKYCQACGNEIKLKEPESA